MNFSENLRLAWSCVRANKMRSILTMLGIIIGISAVITISTIGSSLRETIQKTFSDLTGTNQLAIAWMDPTYEYAEESPTFTLQDMYDYKNAFTGMVSAVNIDNAIGNGTYDGKTNKANLQVVASTEGYCMSYNYKMVYGRDVNIEDSFGNKKVCVVNEEFVKYGLDGMDNPIGQKLEINVEDKIITAYIIGVYKQTKTQMADMSQKSVEDKDKVTTVIIPMQLGWETLETPEDERCFSMFYFFNEAGVDTEKLMNNTKSYFERRIKNETKYELIVQSLEQQLGMINTVLDVITVAISVIAAISLIVGGIGVMNIMLVSVVERTKEIGIRKALGAKNKVIEMQFLVEAVMICAIGGILGILLGLLNGGVISFFVKYLVQSSEKYSMLTVVVRPPMVAILVSFLFSTIVGIVFGLYPARRAARLSPIDALRYE